MEITKDGFHLVIKLEDLGPQFEFFVAYWKREPRAKVRLSPLAFELDFGEAVTDLRELDEESQPLQCLLSGVA